MVVKAAEMPFTSKWGGDWKASIFSNKATSDETIVLVKGHVDPATPTLVRMHTLSMFYDIFGEQGDRADLLNRSMEIIAEAGAGVIVLINPPIKSYISDSFRIKERLRAGEEPPIEELRDYGVGAQILAELGVHDMVLLTNTRHSLIALEGYGLSIVGERAID